MCTEGAHNFQSGNYLLEHVFSFQFIGKTCSDIKGVVKEDAFGVSLIKVKFLSYLK